MANPDTRGWSADPTVVGLAAVVIASALAMALSELRLAGYIGLESSSYLALALAVLHFATVLWVAFKTQSVAWVAYVVATAIAFVAIGAVTPINAAVLLLRVALNI